MSAGEEEEHGYEAIIKALMKALTDIKGSPMDSLKNPTFDWNSSEQFLKTSISSLRGWRAGTCSKVYLTRLVIPHDWSICSISWVKLDKGSAVGEKGGPDFWATRNAHRSGKGHKYFQH